jgi:hypothetical protein
MANYLAGSRDGGYPDSDARRAATDYTATRIVHSSVHDFATTQARFDTLSVEPLEATLYFVGNPLIAREITSHKPGGALYAPFRAAAFGDLTGVHVACDQPSTVFASISSAAIDAIANELDLKIAAAALYACTVQR